MKILKVPISKCDVWKDNPRAIMKEDFERLKKQIQKLGVYKPMIAYKEGSKYIVLGGNMRLRALRELNYKEIEVSVVSPKTEAQKIEYSLSDNDRVGYYEEDKLAELIYNHKNEIDLKDYKVDLDFEAIDLEGVINRVAGEEVVEDEVPEPPKKAKTKTGDLYLLGDHRLLCGDATKKEDVERLMNGKKADMVFTDPPYGIDLDTDFSDMEGIGRGKKYEKIKGDEINYNPQYIFDSFNYCKEIFLWGADYYAELIPKRNDGCFFVWDKTESGIRTNSAYDKMYGSNFELCWSKQKHKRQIIPCLWKGIFGLSKEDTKSRIHPTQKPIKLCSWFVDRFSDTNNHIIDLFGGSGTTLIACEQLNRICYMMEIDPIYCDVIVQRWENFTGKKATLITNAKETKKNSLG